MHFHLKTKQALHSRSTPSNRILPLQAQLDMDESKHEQRSHGVIEDLPIRTVQFGDGGQGEAQGDVLDEIVVGAGVEEEGVGLVVGGGFGGVDETIAHVLFGLDSADDDAVGEVDEVGGKGESPGACDGCNGGSSVSVVFEGCDGRIERD